MRKALITFQGFSYFYEFLVIALFCFCNLIVIMTTELIIKRCNINDLELLRDLAIATFKDAFAPVNTVEDMDDYLQKAFSHEQLQKELLHKDSEFYLAYYKNEPVGYLKINFGSAQTDINDEASLELERIYILKEHQGNGLGSLLIEKVVEIASDKSLDYVWLGVWEKNSRAIQLYGKRGFVKFKSHTFWLGKDKQTDDLMKLEL